MKTEKLLRGFIINCGGLEIFVCENKLSDEYLQIKSSTIVKSNNSSIQ